MVTTRSWSNPKTNSFLFGIGIKIARFLGFCVVVGVFVKRVRASPIASTVSKRFRSV
jgi:hypothetical protein